MVYTLQRGKIGKNQLEIPFKVESDLAGDQQTAYIYVLAYAHHNPICFLVGKFIPWWRQNPNYTVPSGKRLHSYGKIHHAING